MTVIFNKAFRDSRRSMIWLSVGLGLYALMIMSFYPTLIDQSEKFDDLIQSYPEEMLSMFYGGDVAELSISEPGTYIGIEFATWMMLIVGAMVIAQAFSGLTNAERDGSLDLILCLPISRRHILLGRLANTVVYLLVVLGTCLVMFLLSMVIWPEFDPDPGRLVLGIMGTFIPLMTVASFTYMLASLLPSSKRYAGALAYLFLMGSYLVHSFSSLIDQLKWVRSLMLFDYFNPGDTIRAGAAWGDWLVLVAVTVVYLAVAFWAIDRKDMGV